MIYLIKFKSVVDYDMVNAAVVRASSPDEAWGALERLYGVATPPYSSLYPRDSYEITRVQATGDVSVILVDQPSG